MSLTILPDAPTAIDAPDDPDVARFATCTVARASGLSDPALWNWVTRGDIALDHDYRQPGSGRPRRWSYRQALQISIAAELSRRGILPRVATRLALGFTENGNESDVPRAPGTLYETDTTAMVITNVGDGAEARVMPLSEINVAGLVEVGGSVVIVNVSAIVRHVRNVLAQQ